MGLINDVQAANDPDQQPYNNEPVPVIRRTPLPELPQQSAEQLLQQAGIGGEPSVAPPPNSLPATPSPVNPDEQLPVSPENQPNPVDQPVQPAQQEPTETVSTVPENPSLDAGVLDSPDRLYRTTIQPIEPPANADPFDIGVENDALRRGLIERRLINEPILTGSHLPTVYNSPSSPTSRGEEGGTASFNDYNQVLNQPSNNLYSPNPIDGKPRNFDSLSPSINNLDPAAQWAKNALSELPNNQEWIDPKSGLLNGVFYGLGLLQSVPIGIASDVKNRLEQFNASLNVPNQLFNAVSLPLSLALSPFNPKGYQGSYTLDALRGRQYSFTNDPSKVDSPVGLRNKFTLQAGKVIGEALSQIPTVGGYDQFGIPKTTLIPQAERADNLRKNDWITDPGYWAGFAVDAVGDASEPLFRGLGAAFRKVGIIKRPAVLPTVPRGVKVPDRVIVTPEPNTFKAIPDPWTTPPVYVDLPSYEVLPQKQQPTSKKTPTPATPPPIAPPVIIPELVVPDPVVIPELAVKLPDKTNVDLSIPFTRTADIPDLQPPDVLVTPDKPVNTAIPFTRTADIPDLQQPDALVKPDVLATRESSFTRKQEPPDLQQPDALVTPDAIDFTNPFSSPEDLAPIIQEPVPTPPTPVEPLPPAAVTPEKGGAIVLFKEPPLIEVNISPAVITEEITTSPVVKSSLSASSRPFQSDFSPETIRLKRVAPEVTKVEYILKRSAAETNRIAIEELNNSGNIQRMNIPAASIVADVPVKVSVLNDDGKVVKTPRKSSKATKSINNALGGEVSVGAVDVSTPQNPTSTIAADLANDSLRVSGNTVSPTTEVIAAVDSQLVRARAELRRLKSVGAEPGRIKRQQELVVKLTNEAMVDESEDTIETVVKSRKPSTPSIDATVLRGSLTFAEVNQILTDGVPGTTIDDKVLRTVDRKLPEIEALLKVLPHPLTGEPIISTDRTNVFRKWSGTRSPKQLLQKLGIEDPAYYRLVERNGAALDINALKEPNLRITVNKATPTSPSKEVVLSNVPPTPLPVVNDLPAVPLPDKPTDLNKELARLTKQLNRTEDPTTASKLINKILDIEQKLASPDLTNPVVLKELQNNVIPDNMHGTSPEVVVLTQQKFDAEIEMSNAGNAVQELEAQAARQKALIDEQVLNLQRTDDIDYAVESNVSQTKPPMVDGADLTITERINKISTEANDKVKQLKDESTITTTPSELTEAVNSVRKQEQLDKQAVKQQAAPKPTVTTPLPLSKELSDNIKQLNAERKAPVNEDVSSSVLSQLKKTDVIHSQQLIDMAVKRGHDKESVISLVTRFNKTKGRSESKALNDFYESLASPVDSPKPAKATFIEKEELTKVLASSKSAKKALTTGVNNQPIYHGTRADGWTTSSTGVGEYGNASYFTLSSSDATNHALKPTKPGVSGVTPVVHEALPSFVKVINTDDSLTGEVLVSVIRGLDSGMSPSAFEAFKKSMFVKGTTNLKPELDSLSLIYAKVEKFALTRKMSVKRINEIKDAINLDLKVNGYDALINGNHVVVINVDSIENINKYLIPDTDAKGTLLAKANADSTTLANNTDKPISSLASAESNLKLSSQMYDETLQKLDDAKKIQAESIVKMLDTDNELAIAARGEQASEEALELIDAEEVTAKLNERLNRQNKNPCEF
jgi:hypothetical protein